MNPLSTHHLPLLLAALLVLAPTAVDAAASATPPPALGATVAGMGAGTYPEGILATEINVTQTGRWTVSCINEELRASTQEILLALQGQLRGQGKLAEAQSSRQLELAKQIEQYRLQLDLERKLHPASQAANTCLQRDGAAAFGIGREAEADVGRDRNVRMTQVGDGQYPSHQQAADAMWLLGHRIPADAFPEGGWIFPEEGLLKTDDAAKADEVLRLAVNPNPTPKVSEASLEYGAGQEALYRQRIKASRLAVAHDTNTAIWKAHAAVYLGGDVVRGLLEGTGIRTDAAPPADSGATSAMALFDVFSKARLGNPNFIDDLTLPHDPSRYLREMTVMQAIQLEMQRRQLLFSMREASMVATILGILVEGHDNPSINAILYPVKNPVK
jgi:hypothetical protein